MGTLTRMRNFIDVVEAEGFSAASRKTHRSKALLSKHVMELEDELGVLLLNRTTRQLSLTQAGHAYYLKAVEIVKELDDLKASLEQTHSTVGGRVKLSASRTFADAQIGQSLIDFLVQYPQIRLDIHIDDRFVDLVEEGFDLALRITNMEDSSLIAKKLTPIRIVTIASKKFIAENGEPEIPQDLKNFPCIIDRNNRKFNNWLFMDKNRHTFSVAIDGPLEVNGPVITASAARAGLGFSRLPYFTAAADITKGELKVVLADYEIKDIGLYAVYPERRYLPVNVRLMLDFLTHWFKKYDRQART